MNLKKQLETEMEYWEAIESLGGIIWWTDYDVARGRIPCFKDSSEGEIQEARRVSFRLVSELKEKFGVIPPQECPKIELGQERPVAPRGKIYYWDWYEKLKERAYRMDYEKIICSACPLSEGVKTMIRLGRRIPCRVFGGMMYKLPAPYRCGMMSYGDWTDEKLYKEILRKGGEVALLRFKIKRAGLVSLCDLGKGEICV